MGSWWIAARVPFEPTNFYGSEQFYLEHMGETQFRLFTMLELFDPFRSWWFQVLLLFLFPPQTQMPI